MFSNYFGRAVIYWNDKTLLVNVHPNILPVLMIWLTIRIHNIHYVRKKWFPSGKVFQRLQSVTELKSWFPHGA